MRPEITLAGVHGTDSSHLYPVCMCVRACVRTCEINFPFLSRERMGRVFGGVRGYM